MRVKLTGINTIRKRLAGGTVRVYHYHRASGLRLEGKPGSGEFLASYARAEETMAARHAGETFAKIIRAYSKSPEFEQKADSTQAEYRRMLARIEHEFGDLPIGALDDPKVRRHFYDWRDKVHRTSGPRAGDNHLSVTSAVLSWAVKRGHIGANHVIGFERLYKADRSQIIWLPEHIAAFERIAPTALQRALTLALHTGQRQGDLLRMAWTSYDGLAISIRQGKTGRHVTIPCTQALKAMLDGMERKAMTILTNQNGRPWKARWFKAQWARTMEKAGIDGLHFHDLRGTAITMLAEAGCTAPEIAAITGLKIETTSAILDRYLARTAYLAGNAITKLETHRRT